MINLAGLVWYGFVLIAVAPLILAFAKSVWTPRLLCLLFSAAALGAALPGLQLVTSYQFALGAVGASEDKLPAVIFSIFALPIALWLAAMICGLACHLNIRASLAAKVANEQPRHETRDHNPLAPDRAEGA
ncbi:MAG: hypothetical protein U1E67_00125 [Hyphomicrobiales bacterium]